jgi:SAM-dependent methyltransferase
VSDTSEGGDQVASEIYERRFPDVKTERRAALWQAIAGYLQRYVPLGSAILDIGAGNGEFISNIRARERWASDIRDTSDRLDPGVRFILCDGLSLLENAPAGYFDRVFMSNYLEHLPSSEAVIEQLRVVARLLKPGGQAIILQPNIALIGPAYWDFIDHKVPLTERSLAEAVELAGMRPIVTIRRFLPYTTKGRLPSSAALAKLYLAFRPAWWLMGKQTLMIAELPAA